MTRRVSQRKPLIRDIALEAGVSLATASNVLGGRKQVDSEAGRRVLAVAKKMGYERKAAQAARPRRIRFILYKKHGLVVMDTPFFNELITGIESACRRFKYELIISYITASGDDTDERLRAILSDESSAILLLATEMDETDMRPFLDFNAPLLVLDSMFVGASLDTVTMNNVEAGLIATRHLIQNGHRRIGYIGSVLPFNNMNQRFAGYEMALSEAGFAPLEEDVFLVEPTMDGSHRDMQSLLASRGLPRATAFFAGNDIIAVGCARAMKEAGLRLPDDVSLVGMDDMPVCQIVNPALTTIRVPKREMGAAAVSRLIQMIEYPDDTIQKTLINVDIVERNSVLALKTPAKGA